MWVDHSATGGDTSGTAIRGQLFQIGVGKVGGEFLVNTTTTGDQLRPDVVALASGGFVVVWQDESAFIGDTSGAAIQGQYFHNNGGKNGTEFQVNQSTGGDQAFPAAAVNANGQLVVTWQDASEGAGDPNGLAVRGRIFSSPSGFVAGNEFVIPETTSGDQARPAIATLADNRMVVVWEDFVGGSNTIKGQVLNANGASVVADFLVAQGLGGDQTDPSVAVLKDGRFVVTWTDASMTGTDTAGTAIRGQIFDPREQAISLAGTPQNDDYVGTIFNDLLNGSAGNDTLMGAGGLNNLNGGDGASDTAVYQHSRMEYDVRTFLSGGVLKTNVMHYTSDLIDGGDTLTGIETLQYGGLLYSNNLAALNKTANVAGSRFDDVVFQNAGTGQVYYAKMKFGQFVAWGALTDPLGGDWEAVGSGNVDPGPLGAAEVFVQNKTNGTILYVGLDTGAPVWGVVSASLTGEWKFRGAADINGDASADVVIQNTTTGAILYADMAGGAFQSWEVVSQNLTTDWVAVDAGDMNDDGFADVVVQQQSTGAILYANMAGGQFVDWGIVSNALTPDWKAIAVANMNGNGFGDVVVQNLAGGDGVNPGTTVWAELDSDLEVSWRKVTTAITEDWVARSVADIDNDGSSDVLFQHAVDGITVAANAQGSFEPQWLAVASNAGTDWQVV